MTTQKQGVTCVYNDEKELIAVIHKDETTRKNVFYSCGEMSMEQLEELVGSSVVKLSTPLR